MLECDNTKSKKSSEYMYMFDWYVSVHKKKKINGLKILMKPLYKPNIEMMINWNILVLNLLQVSHLYLSVSLWIWEVALLFSKITPLICVMYLCK